MRATFRMLVSMVDLGLWPGLVFGEADSRTAYRDAATAAYERGDYAEAERMFGSALKLAEGRGSDTARFNAIAADRETYPSTHGGRTWQRPG
jgi:hypothetical protein